MQTWKQFFFFFLTNKKTQMEKNNRFDLFSHFLDYFFIVRRVPRLCHLLRVCPSFFAYLLKIMPQNINHMVNCTTRQFFLNFFYWSQRLLRHLSVPQTELISTIDGRHLTPLFCTPEDVQFFQGFSKQRWATRTRTPAAIGFLSVARHV